MMAQRMFYPDLQCTFLKCIRGPASNFYVGTEDMMIDLPVKLVVRILKTRDPTKNKKCALLPEHCRKLTGKASHLSGIPCLKQLPDYLLTDWLFRRPSPTYEPPEPEEAYNPDEPKEDDSEARSVFVSQLAARLTARDLGYFFEDKLGEGAVMDSRIVTDRISRRSKG